MPAAAPTLALPGNIWLASDLHLQEQTPVTAEAFSAWLLEASQQAEHILLPGDIFDAWVGDDALAVAPPWLRMVVDALAQAGARTDLWLGHGNRDFMMGSQLAEAIGARLLPEQAVLETDIGRVLLLHGDELCTDDLAYQQMRQIVRNPQWQAGMMARPLPERIELGRQLRAQSESGKAGKSLEIMDVNLDAVQAMMRRHGVTRLLHGHTHRPARHAFLLDGQPAERWVLPDWDLEQAPGRGGWIHLDRDGLALNDLTA